MPLFAERDRAYFTTAKQVTLGLTLDAGITPGDHPLLTSMELSATGQRLAILDGPTGPSPATVLLESGRVTE